MDLVQTYHIYQAYNISHPINVKRLEKIRSQACEEANKTMKEW